MRYRYLERPPPEQTDYEKKARALAFQLGLTPEERYELLRMVPFVDTETGGSWLRIPDEQFCTLIDYMEGFLLLTYIYSNRKKT